MKQVGIKFEELNEQAKVVAREWWLQERLDDFYASNWSVIEKVVIQCAKDNGIEFNGKYFIDWDYDGDIYLVDAKLKEEKLIEIVNNVLDKEARETFKFLLDNEVFSLDNEVSRTIYLCLEGDNYRKNEISEVVVEDFKKTIKRAANQYVSNLIDELESLTQKEMEKYKANDFINRVLITENYQFTKEGKRVG